MPVVCKQSVIHVGCSRLLLEILEPNQGLELINFGTPASGKATTAHLQALTPVQQHCGRSITFWWTWIWSTDDAPMYEHICAVIRLFYTLLHLTWRCSGNSLDLLDSWKYYRFSLGYAIWSQSEHLQGIVAPKKKSLLASRNYFAAK